MRHRAENLSTHHLLCNFVTIYFSQKSQLTGMLSWNLDINVLTSEVLKTRRWVMRKKILVYQTIMFLLLKMNTSFQNGCSPSSAFPETCQLLVHKLKWRNFEYEALGANILSFRKFKGIESEWLLFLDICKHFWFSNDFGWNCYCVGKCTMAACWPIARAHVQKQGIKFICLDLFSHTSDNNIVIWYTFFLHWKFKLWLVTSDCCMSSFNQIHNHQQRRGNNIFFQWRAYLKSQSSFSGNSGGRERWQGHLCSVA